MVGAQCHRRWRVGPPAEETESQPREAGFLRVTLLLWPLCHVPTVPSPA